MNLRSVLQNNTEAAKFINMRLSDDKYADPFKITDSHAPKRSFNAESIM
jgi:hypothetical protein